GRQLKHRAVPSGAVKERGAVEFAGSVQRQRCDRPSCPAQARENAVIPASARRAQLEDSTAATRAKRLGSAVKIAGVVEDEARGRLAAIVAALKCVQHRLGPSRTGVSKLEHHSLAEGAASRGRAVQVPSIVED